MRNQSLMFIPVLCMLYAMPGSGQEVADPIGPGPATKVTEPQYAMIDQLYPGGDKALNDYIQTDLRYPPEAISNRVSGAVEVTFMLGVDGRITNAAITKGIGSGCDEEALRLVNGMPAWSPAMINGEPAPLKVQLPILFSIAGLEAGAGYTPLELAQRFPGGPKGLAKFLSKNVRHPKEVRQIKGEVRVRVLIDKEGIIKDPRVVGPVHALLDAEALRVVSMMPNMEPMLFGQRTFKPEADVTIVFPPQKVKGR